MNTCTQKFSGFDIRNQAALFLLKVKEVYQVSQTALDGLVADMEILFNQCLSAIPSVTSDVTIQPFKGLQTRYSQEKHFTDVLGLIVC